MVFSSPLFLLLFLPLTLLLYFGTPRAAKSYLLLLSSVIFYLWGSKSLIVLITALVVWNYFAGLVVARYRSSEVGRACLWLAVAGNLVPLFYYKYFNFSLQSANDFLSFWGVSTIEFQQVALPIGISFFTFQALSYVVDVYRGEVAVQRNIFLLALFILFFPQLIAGPIVRYSDVEKDLPFSATTASAFSYGVHRFILGLAKKVIVADGFAEVANRVFELPAGDYGMAVAWIGISAYAVQIYFDFSGYSDMAIGMGHMFGYRFPENFNYPYIARSIKDFWRRWHVSLSTWFRDYLFIPLGGSRGSARQTYRNLFIVFVCCGLWHGASWNFLVWGLLHGSFLALERTSFGKFLEGLPRVVQHGYALLVVLIAWVFFRIENLNEALRFLGVMFGVVAPLRESITAAALIDNEILFLSLLALLGSVPLVPWLREQRPLSALFARPIPHLSFTIVLMAVLVISVARLSARSYSPFIYFRF